MQHALKNGISPDSGINSIFGCIIILGCFIGEVSKVEFSGCEDEEEDEGVEEVADEPKQGSGSSPGESRILFRCFPAVSRVSSALVQREVIEEKFTFHWTKRRNHARGTWYITINSVLAKCISSLSLISNSKLFPSESRGSSARRPWGGPASS